MVSNAVILAKDDFIKGHNWLENPHIKNIPYRAAFPAKVFSFTPPSSFIFLSRPMRPTCHWCPPLLEWDVHHGRVEENRPLTTKQSLQGTAKLASCWFHHSSPFSIFFSHLKKHECFEWCVCLCANIVHRAFFAMVGPSRSGRRWCCRGAQMSPSASWTKHLLLLLHPCTAALRQKKIQRPQCIYTFIIATF